MIDIELLKAKIKRMTPKTKLFKALKVELLALGYWRNRPRGNPQAGYKAGYGKHKGD